MGKGIISSALKVGNSIGFAAPRNVVFTDWRIAFTYLGFLAMTLYYCYLTAVNAQGYLYKEIPTGDIAVYASSGTHKVESLALHANLTAAGAGGRHKYCNNPDFDYTWSESFKYANMSCAFLHWNQISSKNGPSISFTTSFTTTRFVSKPTVTTDAACDAACVSETGSYADFNGRCRCVYNDDYFVVAPEALDINFLSYFSWSRRDGLPSRTVAVKGEGTAGKPFQQICFDPPGIAADDPACLSNEKETSKQTPGKGRENYLKFPVRDLLALADIDLDAVPEECGPNAPLPDQPGYECRTQSITTQELIQSDPSKRRDSSTMPRSRLTGLVVAIEAKYYNRHQAYLAFDGKVGKQPPLDTEEYHDDYLCVLRIKPYYQWNAASGHETQDADTFVVNGGDPDGITTTVSYRYGVTFTFTSTGTVADFDPNAVLLYVVTLIVTLSFAATVTNLIATKVHYILFIPGVSSILEKTMIGAYIMGLIQRTKTYDAYSNMKLSATTSYAKYAVHAVVASEAFKILDVDKTGFISAKELRRYFADMLSVVDFDEKGVDTLLKYVFAVANNDGEGEGSVPDDDETISLNEFIEIFTEDTTTLTRLKETMKADDAVAKVDGKIVKMLKEKLEGGKSTRSVKLTKRRSQKEDPIERQTVVNVVGGSS